MNKPITIQVKEFKDDLAKLVNESKLPAFIIRPIILDLYNEMINLEQIEYQQDLATYEKTNKKGEKDV